MAYDIVDGGARLVRQVEAGMPAMAAVDHKVAGVEVHRLRIGHLLAVFEIEALGVDGGIFFGEVAQSGVVGGLLLAGQVKGAQVAAGYEPGAGIGVECAVDLVEDAQVVPDLVDGVAYFLVAA